MNPSPAQIIQIRAFAANLPGDALASPAALVAAANALAVVDPAAGPVPRPFAVADLLGALNQSTVAYLADSPTTLQILDAVRSNDRAACTLWLQTLVLAGKISSAEAEALAAILTAADPAPKTSWARLNFGRDLDQLDVLAAREA